MLPFYPIMQVNATTFNLAFRIESRKGELINDPRFFDYHFTYEEYAIDNITGTSKIKNSFVLDPEVCSTKHYPEKILKHEKLHNYICLKSDFKLGGDWSNQKILLPQMLISRCNKITEKKHKIKCASPEEIKEKYNNDFYLDTYIQKNLIDPMSYDHPIVKTFHYHFKSIDLNTHLAQKQTIYYSKNEIETDSGVIFEDLYKRQFLEFNKSTEELVIPDSQFGELIGKIRLRLSRNSKQYIRIYLKIPDILAVVGGFMSLIYTILQLIYFPIWDTSFNNFLQSKLFRLELDPNLKEFSGIKPNLLNQLKLNENNIIELKKIDDNISSNIENRNNVSNLDKSSTFMSIDRQKSKKSDLLQFIKNPNERYVLLNNELENLMEFKAKERKEVDFSLCDRFLFRYCCRGNSKNSKDEFIKNQMFNTARLELYKKTQIVDMIKFIDEVNLLKKIFLNEQQCFMIENGDLQTIVNYEPDKKKE